MTKENSKKGRASTGKRILDTLKDLWEQVKEDAGIFGGMIAPRSKPVLQPIPIPVLAPRRRR
jgi:hypothetical protein